MKMMSEEDALETNVSEILDSPETTTLPLFEGQFQWNKASSLKTPLSENLTQKHLMDKRLAIADLEKQKLENDLKFQKEEQALKLELLKLQIINEKKRL
ncbi:hypothetical protein D910_00253 [Dendroctonus ponderosae]|uniref:Uncharacterized protein n=1 Tax=Dendroctonus ponderosae TaxID=77166 RepID=U4UZH1_DENPD|nr:hypothetical protein D910_00253 [Dendroctonus ponderosae]